MERTTQRMMMGSVLNDPVGQQAFTASGTFSFVVPNGVGSISAVAIESGHGGDAGTGTISGDGGTGGSLRWISALAVTPGETLTVIVAASSSAGAYPSGFGGSSNFSAIKRGSTTIFSSSDAIGGVVGGGNGGTYGSANSQGTYGGGGGGAGGYSGNGGRGGDGNGAVSNTDGTGGAGAGGSRSIGPAWRGGGVGYMGAGANGTGNGGNGSGTGANGTGAAGYGAGGGGGDATTAGSSGIPGAVRIIWGLNRAYPSTRVADETP